MCHQFHFTEGNLGAQSEQLFIKVRLRPSVLISWAVLPSAKQLVARQAVGDPADGIEEWSVRECGKEVQWRMCPDTTVILSRALVPNT